MPSRVAVTTAQSATERSAILSAKVVPRLISSTTLPDSPSLVLDERPSMLPYVALRRSTMSKTSCCTSCSSRLSPLAGLHTCTMTILSASSGC